MSGGTTETDGGSKGAKRPVVAKPMMRSSLPTSSKDVATSLLPPQLGASGGLPCELSNIIIFLHG